MSDLDQDVEMVMRETANWPSPALAALKRIIQSSAPAPGRAAPTEWIAAGTGQGSDFQGAGADTTEAEREARLKMEAEVERLRGENTDLRADRAAGDTQGGVWGTWVKDMARLRRIEGAARDYYEQGPRARDALRAALGEE